MGYVPPYCPIGLFWLGSKRAITASERYAFMKQIEIEQPKTVILMEIVAAFLKQLCVYRRFDPHGFVLPYENSFIASRLGMDVETLSRILPKLWKLGITVNKKHVSFDNFQGFDQKAHKHLIR